MSAAQRLAFALLVGVAAAARAEPEPTVARLCSHGGCTWTFGGREVGPGDFTAFEIMLGPQGTMALNVVDRSGTKGFIGLDRPPRTTILSHRPAGSEGTMWSLMGFSDPQQPGCIRVELERSRGGSSLSGFPWATPGSITPCPNDSFSRDEWAGDTLMRTCGRLLEDATLPIQLLTVVARAGRITGFALSRTDSGEPDWSISRACWPWVTPEEIQRAPVRADGVEFTRADDGTMAIVEAWADGLRRGPYLVLRADGSPAVIGEYFDDLMHGIWAWTDAAGRVVAAKLFVYGVDALELTIGLP